MTDPRSIPDVAGHRSRWRWIGPVVVFLISCGMFEVSSRIVTLPPAWRTFEFCQYAEIGRNLATEGSYNTRLVEPMALAMIDRDQVGPKLSGRWPVVNRYPLPCFVVAGLMKLVGTTDRAAAWSNGLAVSLLAALLYAAARAWLGGGWAVLVAVFWLANPAFTGEFVLLGTPDVWFAALFLAEVMVWTQFDPALARAEPKRVHWRWAAVVGLLGGLSYLARFNATVFLAIQVLILGVVWRRWREAIVLTASAFLVATPSMVDTWRHFGRPTVSLYSAWNLLDGIGAYRVEPWLYYQVPDLSTLLTSHTTGIIMKVTANALILAGANGIWRLWRLDILIPLALAGFWLAGGRGSAWRRGPGLALGLFGLQLVLFSGLRLEVGDPNGAHNGRYFFWFAPFAVLLGVATLRRLVHVRWRVGWLIVGVAVGWQLVVMETGWARIGKFHLGESTNIGNDPIRLMLTEVVKPNQVIASTQPHITAWFCGLQSISLPANPDELTRLNAQSPTPADYLFIDMNFLTIDLDRRWALLTGEGGIDVGPWEAIILRNYQYVLAPQRTRPLQYVLLRRKNVAPSSLEQRYKP